MKATGIVRKLDVLGRVCLPKETRRVFGISEGDAIEFFIDGDRIILRKYEHSCVFCGSDEVVTYKGKKVCVSCLESMRGLVKKAG